MLEYVAQIAGYVRSAVEYFISSCQGFAYMLEIVINSLAIPPLLRPYLPSFFGVAITTVVVIAVVKGIFGR